MNDHDRALAVLERDGHVKHMTHARDHGAGSGHCVAGLYQQAIREDGLDVSLLSDAVIDRLNAAYAQLHQTLGFSRHACDAFCGQRHESQVINNLVSWNDADERTADDVAHALKRASELHELAAETTP